MNLMLNALPDPSSQTESLRRLVREKQERIEHLEAMLRSERESTEGIEAAVGELRGVLSPLYRAMQAVFGHLDAIGDAPVASSGKQEVWESWKQKLGGLTAKAIDVLKLHGPMNQTQLRIQLACASRSVTNIISALNKAGLIDRVDGKIALKQI